MPLIIPANTLSGGYEVANSCRFNDGDSAYLEKNFSSTQDSRRKFTVSAWVKRSDLITSTNIWGSSEGSGEGYNSLKFENHKLQYLSGNTTNSGTQVNLETNRLFRDVSAWYHIVLAVDTSQGTDTNRIKLYVNGTQETSFNTSTYPSQDTDLLTSTTPQMTIGMRDLRGTNAQFFDGYISEFCFIDNQQLTPSSFGEFDEDSPTIFKPIDVSGLTFGTNGFYLDFENSGSLGADVSGNGNNFTVNNLTSDDQVIDTPTNNYATLNSLNSWGTTVLSEGNKKITNTTTAFDNTSATIEMNSGKWYFEFYVVSHTSGYSAIAYFLAGTGTFKNAQTSWITNGDGSFGIGANERKITDGVSSNASFSDLNAGDKVQIAYDSDSGKAWFGINNTWIDSGNPSSGTNPYFSSTKLQNNDVVLKLVSYDTQGVSVANFGQDSSFAGNTTKQSNQDSNSQGNFYYSPPTDFLALNTKNLAEFG